MPTFEDDKDSGWHLLKTYEVDTGNANSKGLFQLPHKKVIKLLLLLLIWGLNSAFLQDLVFQYEWTLKTYIIEFLHLGKPVWAWDPCVTIVIFKKIDYHTLLSVKIIETSELIYFIVIHVVHWHNGKHKKPNVTSVWRDSSKGESTPKESHNPCYNSQVQTDCPCWQKSMWPLACMFPFFPYGFPLMIFENFDTEPVQVSSEFSVWDFRQYPATFRAWCLSVWNRTNNNWWRKKSITYQLELVCRKKISVKLSNINNISCNPDRTSWQQRWEDSQGHDTQLQPLIDQAINVSTVKALYLG